MNLNEAIKKIKSENKLCFEKCEGECGGYNYKDGKCYCADSIVVRALEEYIKIGTVEECREARERQRGKKPEKHGTTRQGLDNDGHSVSHQEDCYVCPNCEAFLGYVFDCKDENYQDDYCRNCGQSISWEGE